MRFFVSALICLGCLAALPSPALTLTPANGQRAVDRVFAQPASMIRPVASSDLVLGDFARLARNAEIHPELLAISDAAMERSAVLLKFYENELAWSLRNNGKVTESYVESIPLLKMALSSETKAQEKRRRALAWKAEFLEQLGFAPAPLPGVAKALARIPIEKRSKTRVEVYQRKGDPNLYVIFHQRANLLDWVLPSVSKTAAQVKDTLQYEVADKILAEIKRQYPKTPMVLIGHGQGGAIAQYVGKLTGMPVVGFNVAGVHKGQMQGPLKGKPKETQARVRNNVHLYSAVYRSMFSSNFIPDPISIKKRVSVSSHLANTFTDVAHLDQPYCLYAKPEPFYTDEQDQAMAFDVALVLAKLSIGKFALLVAGVEGVVKFRIMKDALWDRDHPQVDPYLIKQHAQGVLMAQGIKAAKNIKGVVGAIGTGRDLIKMDLGSIAKTIALGSAGAASVWAVKQELMAHDMARFVEGLESSSAADIHLLEVDPETHPWLSQCKPLQAAFVFPEIPAAEATGPTQRQPESPLGPSTAGEAGLEPEADTASRPADAPSPSETPTTNTQTPLPPPDTDAAALSRQDDPKTKLKADSGFQQPAGHATEIAGKSGAASGPQTSVARRPAPLGEAGPSNLPPQAAATASAPADTGIRAPICNPRHLVGRWQGRFNQGDKTVPFDLDLLAPDQDRIAGTSIEEDTRPLRWGKVKADWIGSIEAGLFRFQKRYQVDPSFFSEYVGVCDASGMRIEGEWKIPDSRHQGRFELVKDAALP